MNINLHHTTPQGKSSPLVSLVIGTYNGRDVLGRLLKSLRMQTYTNFEVFIADQNSPDYLDEIINEYSDLPITRMLLPPCGASISRNTPMPHIAGEIVAFPDDDCWYEVDTLEQVVSFFTANKHYFGALALWLQPGQKKVTINKLKLLNKYSAIKGSQTFLQFWRREVIDTVGGFDPNLAPGPKNLWVCGEDSDYVLRALEAGFGVARLNNVFVNHPLLEFNSPALLEKTYGYGRGRMQLLRKHCFPFWFRLVNVVVPIIYLPRDIFNHGLKMLPFRWAMFRGRLVEFVRQLVK